MSSPHQNDSNMNYCDESSEFPILELNHLRYRFCHSLSKDLIYQFFTSTYESLPLQTSVVWRNCFIVFSTEFSMYSSSVYCRSFYLLLPCLCAHGKFRLFCNFYVESFQHLWLMLFELTWLSWYHQTLSTLFLLLCFVQWKQLILFLYYWRMSL